MPECRTFVQAPFLMKAIALILGAVCLWLTVDKGVYVKDSEKQHVVNATHYGFFIVSCILVLSYILDAAIHGRLMIIIGICAAAMYVTSGAFYLEQYDKGYKEDKILAVGIVSLVCGVAYLIDAFISWKY